MTPNMQIASLVLLTFVVFGGMTGIIFDSINRHQLYMAGEVATAPVYIKYQGHYLPYEEKLSGS